MVEGNKTVVITGSEGFIGGYVVKEFLNAGYNVIGIDNQQKYGPVERDYHKHSNYILYKIDFSNSSNLGFFKDFIVKGYKPDYMLNFAGVIGGIGHFHKRCYDLISTNERILANFGDLCRFAKENVSNFKKAIWISSSMIYSEASERVPHKEKDIYKLPPPRSAYGFQKLAVHYFAEALYEEYGIPYNVVIPFNAIGIGELKPKDLNETFKSGEIEIAFSHVVPDLILKILKGQDPLRLLGTGEQIRCYTDCRDIAKATRLITENDNKENFNETYNVGTEKPYKVKELGEVIWNMINRDKPYKFELEEGFQHDVQYRVPDCSKLRNKLNFECKISLEESLSIIIPWITEMYNKNLV